MVTDSDVVHAPNHIIDCAVVSGPRRRRQQIRDIVHLDVELPLFHHVKLSARIPIDRTGHVVVVDRRIVRRLKDGLHRAASGVALDVVVAEVAGVKPALYQREGPETIGIILGVYSLPGRNRATLSVVGRAGAVISQRAGFIDTKRSRAIRAHTPLVRLRAQGAKRELAWYAPVVQLELVGGLQIHASGDDAG